MSARTATDGAGSPCTDSLLARFVCDPSGSLYDLGAWLVITGWALIQAWWPLLAAVGVVVSVAAATTARARTRRRRWEVAGARWWEIIPPHELPSEGAVPLWRLLAGELAAFRRGRVGLMLWADPYDRRVHAGLWVPAGLPAASIARTITRAWPGSRLEGGGGPPLPPLSPVAAVEVTPAAGPWAPLTNHEARAAHMVAETVDEPLRAVLDGLSGIATAGGFAAVQVVVSRTRAPGRSWGAGGGVGRGLVTVGRALGRGLLGVVEIFLPGPQTPQRSATRSPAVFACVESDPLVVTRERGMRAKQAAGPHLRASVRLVVAGTDWRSMARRRCRELAAALTGLAVESHEARIRPVRRGSTAVLRTVAEFRHGRSFFASTRELAALWHLPTDPARYGLPQPSVEHRAPTPQLTRLDDYRDRRANRSWPDSAGGGHDAA